MLILRPNPNNGLLGWPNNWTLRRYNACNEPCDMLIGPCACGEMHDADEEWVQRALELNNARIEYRPPSKRKPPEFVDLVQIAEGILLLFVIFYILIWGFR